MLWDNTTVLGSVIEYVCKDGFYQEGGNSLSTCISSGQWGIVSIICKGTVTISHSEANPILLRDQLSVRAHCNSYCRELIILCQSAHIQIDAVLFVMFTPTNGRETFST